MTDTKNLYQKLLAITEEIGKIEKTGKNTQQGYAFIEQAMVASTLRPLLHKYGVMIMPETVSRTVERYQTAKGTDAVHANVVSRYTVINADDPNEKMVCEWDAGEAVDYSDKATNKATTASNKTFLMKLFNISDKDDADADSPTVPSGAPAKTYGGSSNLATPKQKIFLNQLYQDYFLNYSILIYKISYFFHYLQKVF
jgi:hypothetical protein